MTSAARRADLPRPALLVSHLRPGGKEMCVVNLANELHAQGCTPLVVTFEDAAPLSALLHSDRIKVIALGKHPGNDALLPLRLARILRLERIGLVHCHNWGTLLEGIAAARVAGIRAIVHTQHGLDFGTDHSRGRHQLVRTTVKRLAWRWLSHIAAVSTEVAEMVVDEWRVPATRVSVVHNGIAPRQGTMPAAERAARRAALGLAPHHFVIGSVGALRPVKDYQTLIDAVARLVPTLPDVRLMIAGDGPSRPDLESAIAAASLSGHVLLLGQRADVPDLLPLMDLFALSSLSEGISIAILEAMSQELPVVATCVGGNTEMIRDGYTGVLVDVRAGAQMASAILSLATNAGRRATLGREARAVVDARFSLSQMGDAYRDLYRAAYAAARPAGPA